MKSLLILSALLLCFASCTKERDYLCTVVQTNPEGIVYQTTVTHTFRGTYPQMKRHEVNGTHDFPGTNSTVVTTCK